jgi:hypothetical protein
MENQLHKFLLIQILLRFYIAGISEYEHTNGWCVKEPSKMFTLGDYWCMKEPCKMCAHGNSE